MLIKVIVTTRIFIEFTFKYFYLNIKSLIGFWSEKLLFANGQIRTRDHFHWVRNVVYNFLSINIDRFGVSEISLTFPALDFGLV